MRYFAIAAGLGLLLITGYLHGRWTGRWHFAGDVQDAVARLDAVPHKIGDWEGEDAELDAQQREVSGGDGFLVRRFTNSLGTKITVLIVCGRPGPVSVHSPEVCYQAVGAIVNAPESRTIEFPEPHDDATFKVIRVQNAEDQVLPTRLEVFWTWNAHGKWETPSSPRLTFARYPYLYKLYVIRTVERGEEDADNPTPDFLKLLLPELEKALFPEA
jgi:hypothetical protein